MIFVRVFAPNKNSWHLWYRDFSNALKYTLYRLKFETKSSKTTDIYSAAKRRTAVVKKRTKNYELKRTIPILLTIPVSNLIHYLLIFLAMDGISLSSLAKHSTELEYCSLKILKILKIKGNKEKKSLILLIS